MVRSLSTRGVPKPVAIAVAFALAIFFVPFVGGSSASAATQYTLEGCRLAAGETLPNADGDFICQDADYTTGNLGKLWNELDLVPYRTTIDGGGSNAFVIAGIRRDLAVVVAPIAALAPGFTVLWAMALVHERVATAQRAGLVLALAGLVLIAAG